MEKIIVHATPHTFPKYGELTSANSALLIIDMQHDFCAEGGYMHALGYDIAPLRLPIEPIQRTLTAARAAGLLVIHTRQGHRRDLADFSREQLEVAEQAGEPISSANPHRTHIFRGDQGWNIIPELEPHEGEIIVDKTANNAFYGTDLEPILRAKGIRNLIFAGNTIDVCVHCTLRDANDRGYQCLLLQDCCGAATQELHRVSVEMVKMEEGIFGAVASSHDFCQSIATP